MKLIILYCSAPTMHPGQTQWLLYLMHFYDAVSDLRT